MRGKSDLIRIKRKPFYFVLFIFILAIATPVLADYLGPDRATTTSEVDTYDYGVWARDNNKVPYCLDKKGNKADDCVVCEWKRKPGNACGDATYWYTLGTKSEVVETMINLPPAIISSSLQNCNSNNGWCNTLPTLILNGTEPLSGYNILAIEGSLNGQTFACSGSNCNVPLSEGNNDLSFWALSSYGDSSTMGTTSAKVDTVSPSAGLDLIGSSGTNGWYVSPTSLTATGSDSTSGLSSVFLSVNNGAWQSSTILNEGVYNVIVQAEDNAGNISSSSTLVSVDTTTPTIDLAVNGSAGSSGWYSSSMQVSAIVSDATSGVDTLEVTADGGPWTVVSGPVSFADGFHTVQFKAVDKAGNQTETSVQEFYVDTIAPAVDLPAQWEVNDAITYKIQDDGSGLSALRIVIEDEDEKFAKVAWDEAVSANKFKGEIIWNGKFKDGTIAPPGEYLVWVKTTDVAGNERIALGRVIVPQPFASFSFIQPSKSSAEIPTPPADLFEPESVLPTTIPNTTFGGSTTPPNSARVESLTLSSGTASASTTTSTNNVLWGATAAALIGWATAAALEEKKKRKEQEQAQISEVSLQREKAKARASRDEEPPLTRQEKELAKQRKELQKLWDANGAAIYEANREYQAKHGKEIDVVARSKAIKDATRNGVFHAGAYASNLEAEKTRRDAQNEHMASKMTRVEKAEEVRWQAQQKAAQEKQKAADLQAGYAAYYAAMRQGEQEAQSNWWEQTKFFVKENIVQPLQNAWNSINTTAQTVWEATTSLMQVKIVQPIHKTWNTEISTLQNTVLPRLSNVITLGGKKPKLTVKAKPALDDGPPELTFWEKIKEWWRIQSLAINHPEYPLSDSGSGEHAVRPVALADLAFERILKAGEAKFRLDGYDDAARHMSHYLSDSGRELEVDVNEMILEMPTLESAIQTTLRGMLTENLNKSDLTQKTEINFESGWKDIYAQQNIYPNWFYAMGGYYYWVGANAKVVVPQTDSNGPIIKVVYKIAVSDYYNWDAGKATSFDKPEGIKIPDLPEEYDGKIIDLGDQLVVYDTALAELHKAGIAQEFHIAGETEKLIVYFEYNPVTSELIPVIP